MLWAYNPSAGADIGGAWGFLACKDSLGGELPVQGDSVSQNLRGRVIVEDIRCQHRPPTCLQVHVHVHTCTHMKEYSCIPGWSPLTLFVYFYLSIFCLLDSST